MHHVYNDIFHQAAVSQSNSRINAMSFIFMYNGGPQESLVKVELQQDPED